MAISKRVSDRFKAQLRRYTKVLELQRSRDVSEADTVTVVKDLLDEVFGYDKYTEVTGEHAIRGTFCDLAIQIDGQLQLLIEVKAIGSALKDPHIKQAVDYAANQGVDWVILTNGVEWILYHMIFQKPIEHEEVARVNLLEVNLRAEQDAERLFLFSKEALKKNAIAEYRDRKDATSRYMLASILLNCDDVLNAIRRNVRAVSDHLVDREIISKTLREQVLKREVVEGDEAAEASRRLARAVNKKSAAKRKKKSPKKPALADASKPNTPEAVTIAATTDPASAGSATG